MQKISYIVMALGALIGLGSVILYFQIPKQVEIPADPSDPIASEEPPKAMSHKPKSPENLPESSSEVAAPEAEDSVDNLLSDDQSLDGFIKELKEIATEEDHGPPEENQVYTLLEDVFPEIARIKRETYELMGSFDTSTATLEERRAFETKAKALEAEIQDIGKRLAVVFPEAVAFINFQGQEWVKDIDFRALKALAGDPPPVSLQGYFRYASLQEMLQSPD
jgi:hypothetical protein